MNTKLLIAFVLTIVIPTATAEIDTLSKLEATKVKKLIRREIEKILPGLPAGPQGPAGPTGPAGPVGPAGPGPGDPTAPAPGDTLDTLVAYVDYGEVDAARSRGITQQNVRIEVVILEGAQSPNPDGSAYYQTSYCFVGLRPIIGGQLTTDGEAGYADVASPKLWINPVTSPDCPVRVAVHTRTQFPPVASSFYVILY